MYEMPLAVPDCRTVTVAACENDQDYRPNPPFPALATFQLQKRDTLDFTVDFSVWIGANGNPPMTSAEWTVAVGSPHAPTIVGQAFSSQGKTTVVLMAPEGANVGDAYWLDVTADVGLSQPASSGDVAIPARVLVRRVNVVVSQG
jgi:hypothetical protein